MESDYVYAMQSYCLPKYQELFKVIANLGGCILRQQLTRLLFKNRTDYSQADALVKKLLDAGYPDGIYCVGDEEARAMANRLCQEEGIFCGMSSGANVAVALRIAKELGPGKNVVTTIVDRRDRYLSETPLEKYVV